MPGAVLTLLAAGGTDHSLVRDIGACLVAAAVLVVLFERLRLPAIAALLAAGVVVGPVGLSLVADPENIATIADLGLTLLLFVIGLEVNLHSMFRGGRPLLLAGLLQVPLSCGLAWALFVGLRQTGWSMLTGPYTALYLGLACAFSSTLLVAGHLHSRRELDTRSGRLAVGLLIFQDVWAAVVLALQPNFDHLAVTPVLLTLGGIGVVIGVAALLARFVLPAAFRAVGRAPELVVTLALAWCFGLGLFGLHLGDLLQMLGVSLDHEVSVSLAMGALIAGSSIASFPYAHEVIAKAGSLRDFFVTLFFVGLGMSVPLPEGLDVLGLAILLGVVAVAIRQFVFLPLLLRVGVDVRRAAETAIKLAQISEFCLVIMYLGMDLGHVDERFTSAVIFAFVLTAVLTPALFRLAEGSYPRLLTVIARLRGIPPALPERPAYRPRLALLGFHRLGAAIFCELERSNPEVLRHTVVVDLTIALHAEIHSRGAEVVYADLANFDALRHASVDQATIIVITLTDDVLKGTDNLHLVRNLRGLNSHSTIIATASRPADVLAIHEAGADHVFMWSEETALALVPAIQAALRGDLARFVTGRRRLRRPLEERCELLE